MVSSTDTVEVVDTAASVFLCVGKHIDIFVGDMCCNVSKTLEVFNHLVALGVEGVETGICDRVFPYAFARKGYARIFRWCPYGTDIKIVCLFFVGRVAEEFVYKILTCFNKFFFFVGCISFWYEYQIYTLGWLTMVGNFKCFILWGKRTDKIGLWVDILCEFFFEYSFFIARIDFYSYRIFRIGKYD